MISVLFLFLKPITVVAIFYSKCLIILHHLHTCYQIFNIEISTWINRQISLFQIIGSTVLFLMRVWSSTFGAVKMYQYSSCKLDLFGTLKSQKLTVLFKIVGKKLSTTTVLRKNSDLDKIYFIIHRLIFFCVIQKLISKET